jgi:uncharacterized protein YcaQ
LTVSCSALLDGGDVTERVVSEPLYKLRHHLLEARRSVDADELAGLVTAVAEVMRYAAGDQGIATARSVRSPPVDDEAEGAR